MPDGTEVAPLSAGTEAEIAALPEPAPAKGQTYTRLDTYRAALRPTLAYLAGGAMILLPVGAVISQLVPFQTGMTVLASVGGPILGFYFQVRNQQTQGGIS